MAKVPFNAVITTQEKALLVMEARITGTSQTEVFRGLIAKLRKERDKRKSKGKKPKVGRPAKTKTNTKKVGKKAARKSVPKVVTGKPTGKRRGRPPGSKNKPKNIILANTLPVSHPLVLNEAAFFGETVQGTHDALQYAAHIQLDDAEQLAEDVLSEGAVLEPEPLDTSAEDALEAADELLVEDLANQVPEPIKVP